MTSPVQFAGSYKSLMVRLGSTKPPVIVSVADYQNPGPNWVVKYDAMVNGAVNDGGSHGKRWQAAQGVYQQHVKKEGHVIFGEPFPQGFGPLAIQLLHKGGGSPAHIASVLQLAARY